MMVDSDNGGAAAEKSAHTNSVKPSFMKSKTKSLAEKMSKYKERASKKAFPNISSMRAPGRTPLYQRFQRRSKTGRNFA